MPRFSDEGICLAHLPFSETSQVVTLLCRERGKLRGLAKGCRRTSAGAVARYTGGFELLTSGTVTATTRPAWELASVTGWDLAAPRFGLRAGLDALRTGCYAAQLTDSLLEELDPHPTLFDALETLLDALADDPGGDPQAALLAFHWAFFEGLGYRPELTRDVHRDGPLDPAAAATFDPAAGGFTADPGPANWRVRPGTRAALAAAAAGGAAGADRVAERPATAAVRGLPVADVRRANRLLCSYARALLDKELPTMRHVLQGA